ncbi:hypothetical protein LTR67_005295 [Exophiala xenobiotica]
MAVNAQQVEDFDSSDDEYASRMLGIDSNPQPTARRYANAGTQMIERMLDNQAIDRVESKRVVKTLDFVHGSTAGEYKRHSIQNTVEAYFKILKHDPKTCPSGNTILRLIATLVARVKPRGRKKSAPSYKTIVSMWLLIISYLSFQYRDLKDHYTSHDVAHIRTYLNEQVSAGNLLKGNFEEKKWLGYEVTNRMLIAFMRSAYQGGCRNWDIVILRALGVALTLAMCSRNGDLALSSGWHGEQYLKWKDIELSVDKDAQGVQDIKAKFTLRFTKGMKESHNDDKILFLKPTPGATDSCICPIKLLLAHALRNGLCHGTTIGAVIASGLARDDNIIPWKHPDYPVLCAIQDGTALRLSHRALATQIRDSVKLMGNICGIFGVKARDLRRGSARDVAYLPRTLSGAAKGETGLALGHSAVTTYSGITQRYVGPIQDDILAARAAQPFKDMLAPKLLDVAADELLPKVRRKRVKRQDINKRLRQEGIDDVESTRHLRRSMAELIRETELESKPLAKRPLLPPGPLSVKKARLTEDEASGLQSVTSSTTSEAGNAEPLQRRPITVLSASEMNVLVNRARANKDDARIVQPMTPSTTLEEGNTKAMRRRQSTEPLASGINPPAIPLSDLPIDPQLLSGEATSFAVTDLGCTDEEADASRMPSDLDDTELPNGDLDDTTPMVDAPAPYVDEHQYKALDDMLHCRGGPQSELTKFDDVDIDTASKETQTPLVSELVASAFTRSLTFDGDGDFAPADPNALNIHSDLDAEPWLLQGDDWLRVFATINAVVAKKHLGKLSSEELALKFPVGNSRAAPTNFLFYCEKGCGYSHPDMWATRKHTNVCDGQPRPAGAFPCEHPGCTHVAPTENALDSHVRHIHQWKPRTCDRGCTDSVVYDTYNQWLSHVRKVHDKLFESSKCPLADGCGSDHLFETRDRMRAHLRTVHALSLEEIDAFVPRKPNRQGKTQVETCPTIGCEKTFKSANELEKHLIRSHKLTQDDATARAEQLLGPVERRPDRKQSVNTPQPCPRKNVCKSTSSFPSPWKMAAHLTSRKHKMSKEDADKLAAAIFGKEIIPRRKKSEKPTVVQCPFKDVCRSELSFSERNTLIKHLTTNKHRMTKEDAAQFAGSVFGVKDQPNRHRRNEGEDEDEDDDI